MDLSYSATYDKEESFLLSIAKSSLGIVENTLSKPQENLEFKMTKQKESFSFRVPLELPGQWKMGETSLEEYNTVYNNTEKNTKLKILLKDERLKLNIDTQLAMNVDVLYHTSGNLEKANKFIADSSYKNKKLIRNYFNSSKKIRDRIKLDTEGASRKESIDTEGASRKENINVPEFGIENDFFEIELTPGVYEIVDINITIK